LWLKAGAGVGPLTPVDVAAVAHSTSEFIGIARSHRFLLDN
jgi:hypothetical protein